MTGATTRPARNWTAPRTRGMAVGFCLMLLGAWGTLIPFIGPYWNYAYSPNSTWTWTTGRGYLEVLPGIVAFLAGIVVMLARNRAVAWLAAWAGIAAGAWFVIGPLVTPLWSSTDLGTPVGGTRSVAVEQIGIFYGLGAAIILFAAVAVGRFSMTAARDVPVPAPDAVADESTDEPTQQPEVTAAPRTDDTAADGRTTSYGATTYQDGSADTGDTAASSGTATGNSTGPDPDPDPETTTDPDANTSPGGATTPPRHYVSR